MCSSDLLRTVVHQMKDNYPSLTKFSQLEADVGSVRRKVDIEKDTSERALQRIEAIRSTLMDKQLELFRYCGELRILHREFRPLLAARQPPVASSDNVSDDQHKTPDADAS